MLPFEPADGNFLGVRTDLSTIYPLSPRERSAQGYLNRSEWAHDAAILLHILEYALDPTNSITWEQWSIEEECRKLRVYHFEELDYDDQMTCRPLVVSLEHAEARLKDVLEARKLECLREIIVQYVDFADQARQLYNF